MQVKREFIGRITLNNNRECANRTSKSWTRLF